MMYLIADEEAHEYDRRRRLIGQARKGDPRARAELYSLYKVRLYGHAKLSGYTTWNETRISREAQS